MRARRAPTLAIVAIWALAAGACSEEGPSSGGGAEGTTSRPVPVSASPPQAPVVSCRDRIEYPAVEGDPLQRKRDYYDESVRIGPVALYPGRTSHPNFGPVEPERVPTQDASAPIDPIVPAGKTVTLAVAPADRDRVRLGLEAKSRAATTFAACPADGQRFSDEGTLGSLTAFKEMLRVAEPGCATLYLYADGRRFERTVSFGVEHCPGAPGG